MIKFNGKQYSNLDKLQFINDYSNARFIDFKQVREGSENLLFNIDNAIEIENNNILKYKNQISNDLSLNDTERIIKTWLILGTKEYILLLNNLKNDLQQDKQHPAQHQQELNKPIKQNEKNDFKSLDDLFKETFKLGTKIEILKNIDLFLYTIYNIYGKTSQVKNILENEFLFKSSSTLKNFSMNKEIKNKTYFSKMQKLCKQDPIKSKFSKV